jgi:hypothetical protein
MLMMNESGEHDEYANKEVGANSTDVKLFETSKEKSKGVGFFVLDNLRQKNSECFEFILKRSKMTKTYSLKNTFLSTMVKKYNLPFSEFEGLMRLYYVIWRI